jgi:hypothetical protein
MVFKSFRDSLVAAALTWAFRANPPAREGFPVSARHLLAQQAGYDGAELGGLHVHDLRHRSPVRGGP